MPTLAVLKWKINVNGYVGDLLVESVDAAGKVTGKLFGDKLTGLWDQSAQRLAFVRILSYGQQDDYQFYTGFAIDHLFQNPTTFTGTPALPQTILTGWFECFQGTGGMAAKSVGGWLAWLPSGFSIGSTLGPPYVYWYGLN